MLVLALFNFSYFPVANWTPKTQEAYLYPLQCAYIHKALCTVWAYSRCRRNISLRFPSLLLFSSLCLPAPTLDSTHKRSLSRRWSFCRCSFYNSPHPSRSPRWISNKTLTSSFKFFKLFLTSPISLFSKHNINKKFFPGY